MVTDRKDPREFETFYVFNIYTDAYKEYNIGIVCHANCYKLLEHKLKYKLKVTDIIHLLDIEGKNKKLMENLLKNVNYGKMTKYISQDFEMLKCLKNDPWLLWDPLKGGDNAKRILSGWEKIPGLSQKLRKSPSLSATKFKVRAERKGNDGKLWTVVKNKKGTQRWVLIKKGGNKTYQTQYFIVYPGVKHVIDRHGNFLNPKQMKKVAELSKALGRANVKTYYWSLIVKTHNSLETKRLLAIWKKQLLRYGVILKKYRKEFTSLADAEKFVQSRIQ